MIPMKEYVKKIRELLQNTRTRAAAILVLWLFFFLFVFSAFNIRGTRSVKTNYSNLEQWKLETNYEYKMVFSINKEEYLINGIRNGNKEVFSFDDKTYYLESKSLYVFQNDIKKLEESTEILGFNFLKLRPDFLGSLIELGKLEYTTTYESGMVKKGYSVPTEKFVKLYQDLDITDDSFIMIEVLEENDAITQVDLDLINFQKYSMEIYDTYQIKMIYSNVGKVSNIELE